MKQYNIIEEKSQYCKNVGIEKLRIIIMIESLFHYNVANVVRNLFNSFSLSVCL